MPGKLIAFIMVLLVIVTFIGFNVEHTSDIRVWFGEKGTIKNVPIFISFFVMYLIGVLSSLPFIVSRSLKRLRKKQVEVSQKKAKKIKDSGEEIGKNMVYSE